MVAVLVTACGRGPGVGGRAYCDALERVVERSAALSRPDVVPDGDAVRRFAAAVGEVANAAPTEVADEARAWRESLEQTAKAMDRLAEERRRGRAAISAIAVSFGAPVDVSRLAASARERCGVELPFGLPEPASEPAVVEGAPPPGTAQPGTDSDVTLPSTTVPAAGTPTMTLRVAYVGFGSGPGGTLLPEPVDVQVGSAGVLSGIPGPYVSDPMLVPAGTVTYGIGPTDPSSDMRRYQGSTSGVPAGDQLVVATLRLPTGGDVTTVQGSEVGAPSLGQARLAFVLLWPDGGAVRLRPGLPGDGCAGDGRVEGGPFSEPVVVDVSPGRLEIALYAEDDTTCSRAPVVGPSLVGAPAGSSTLVVGWRADDVQKGFLPVPLTER